MVNSLWSYLLLLFGCTYSADIVVNTTNGTATDLICINTQYAANVSANDRCIIHCTHYRGAKSKRIDCMNAGVCILNVIADECALYSIIDASNALQFELHVSATKGVAHAEIYLPSNVNSTAYIFAHDGQDMFHEANMNGTYTETIIVNVSNASRTFNGEGMTIYASHSNHLEIILGPQTTEPNALIYCPEDGLCLIDVDTTSALHDAAIYSFKGTNNDDNTQGLQLNCNDGSATCTGTAIRCDIHYTTYGIAQYIDSQWNYGECGNASRIMNASYDPDWHYVFSERKQSSVDLTCGTGGSKKGCIIQCIHRGTYRNFHCGDGVCIVNLLNKCGRNRDQVFSESALNLTVNVLEPEGEFFKGRVHIDDTETTKHVIINCHGNCEEMKVVFQENNVELSNGNVYSSIEYLEVNVDGKEGSIQSSVIRCPQSSSIQPSCVINCNSNCEKVTYYSLNGVPDLSISCNDSDRDHCASSYPNNGIHCSQNVFANVAYNRTMQQWTYEECFEEAIVNTTATATEDVHTDFAFRFDNISQEDFATINASADAIEAIVDELYENKYDFDVDIEIVNEHELVYMKRSTIMIIRVSYEEMYESDIINYTFSTYYRRELEARAQQRMNATVITVVIIKYINISTTVAIPSPSTTRGHDDFVVDYMQTLFILIWIINGITITLAIVAFCLSSVCKFGTDSAKPFILIMFGLRFTDIITDLNVCYVLWTDYLQHKSDDALLLVLCVSSVLFLFLPWFANIYSISIIRKRLSNNRRASAWFSAYSNSTFFLIVVVLTGDAFFALQLISSYLFGIKRLDAGISEKLEMNQFRMIRIFGVICLEAIPQVMIAAIYAFSIENNKNIALLSMVVSVISIFICIVSWLLLPSPTKQSSYQMIQYTIEMQLHGSVPARDKNTEKRKIIKYVGYKQKLRNNLSLSIGTERDQMEIVYTSMTDNGANIEIVQFVHNMEIGMKNDIQSIEAFIANKYDDNNIHINVMLHQHYHLQYGVTHKIVCNHNDNTPDTVTTK
eukprot:143383_1